MLRSLKILGRRAVSNAPALMFDDKARRTSDFSDVSAMMTGRGGAI
jgi:hypothetical protein